MENIFKVEIKPTLVADVFSSAMNCSAWNKATPVMPISNNGRMAFFGGSSRFSLCQTRGTRQIMAMAHLNMVKVIGDA